MTYNSAQDWPDNPYELFQKWMSEAEKNELNDPNAMCLATIGENNMPSARMVLLKEYDERGFVFYTNAESKKGKQLAHNMKAALCFHWKSSRKQVRIEGDVEIISKTASDAYYHSRYRSSQIGAWASKQSRPLKNREEFDTRFQEYEEKFSDTEIIPRPEYWQGYRVKPLSIELWINEEFRLHRRCLYKIAGNAWEKTMLYP